MYTICFVEDEKDLSNLIKVYLEKAGYKVVTFNKGADAIDYIGQPVDVWILDIMLEDDISGYDIIKEIRKNNSNVPVIFTSARDQEIDKILGLELGADDYITKPFSVNELLARIRANLRRKSSNINDDMTSKFVCNELELDITSRDIFLRSEKLKLTPIEYELLKYFMLHTNKTLTHKQILQEVWGTAYQNEMQYLRTYVNTLRKKIEENSTRPKYIKTESGIGYRFSYNPES